MDNTFSRFLVFFGLEICKNLLIWRSVKSFEVMPVVGVELLPVFWVRLVVVIPAAASFCRRQGPIAQSAGLDMPVQQQHVRPPIVPSTNVESILMPWKDGDVQADIFPSRDKISKRIICISFIRSPVAYGDHVRGDANGTFLARNIVLVFPIVGRIFGMQLASSRHSAPCPFLEVETESVMRLIGASRHVQAVAEVPHLGQSSLHKSRSGTFQGIFDFLRQPAVQSGALPDVGIVIQIQPSE